MATLTRRDFRAIIYYNFARGLSKEEYFKEMSEVFGEDCPSVRTVEQGVNHFKMSETTFIVIWTLCSDFNICDPKVIKIRNLSYEPVRVAPTQ